MSTTRKMKLSFMTVTALVLIVSFALVNCGGGGGAVSPPKVWGTAGLIENNLAGDASSPRIVFDLSGNALAVWTQSDGARFNIWANRYVAGTGWGTAEQIETSNAGHAYYPQVAFDANGNAIAVWHQSDGVRFNIWANRYVAGAGWGTAELIETDDRGDAYYPQIAFDPDGNALAVWQQHDGTRNNIVANRYVAGAGWGTAGLIETDNAGGASNPQIAFDKKGNALAVWDQHNGSRSNIWANRYVTGTGWGTAELIETDNTGSALCPQISFDQNGSAIAVWYQDDGAQYNIMANRYVYGVGWGTAELIETDNAGQAYDPQIALEKNGNALAVWYQYDGTQYSIWANRYVVGVGWGTAGLIETDNAGSALCPQLSFDQNGNAIAVWYQDDGARFNIWANRYTAGVGWGTALLIESDNAGKASSPRIAFDQDGNALVVWYQSDGTRANILANRYVAGTGWGTAELIESDNAGSAYFPQIAFDQNGNALAVWQQHDGVRFSIWANRYVAGTGWGAEALIETDDARDALNPRIAFDQNGNALAVWQQHDGTRVNILANRYVAGTGWGTAELIEGDAGDAASPRIAFDRNGNALAVWEQSDGTQHNIWANRYAVGAGWGTAGLVETDAGDVGQPEIAFDQNGNALTVWNQSDGTRNNIWANRYVVGTGWGTAGLIETDNAGSAYYPQVAFDQHGNALAVWGQSDGTRLNIWANRYVAGTGWGTAVLIETDNAGGASNPQIAFDQNGDALAVWEQSDGTRVNIWANHYVAAGTGWGTAQLIDTDNAGDAASPQIAFDQNRNAFAVWQQHDGTRFNILANRYVAGIGWGTAELIETDNRGIASAPQIAFDPNGNAMAVWQQSDGRRLNIWANRFQ